MGLYSELAGGWGDEQEAWSRVGGQEAGLHWTGPNLIRTSSHVVHDVKVHISQEVPPTTLKTSFSCPGGHQRRRRGHQPTYRGVMAPCQCPALCRWPDINITHRHRVWNWVSFPSGAQDDFQRTEDLNLSLCRPGFAGHSCGDPLQRKPVRLHGPQ